MEVKGTRDIDIAKPGGFCTHCGVVVHSFQGLKACPNCKTQGFPCSFSEDVSITINWHELRLLTIWAERWGMEIVKSKDAAIVLSIVSRINAKYPEKAEQTPLLLSAELAQIKQEFPKP